MPKPRGKRTTLTVDRELFEEFFVIDSWARTIVVDALGAGIIETPYEALEMLCVANRKMAEIFVDEIALDLAEVGKDEDYIAALEVGDNARANSFIDQYISSDRHTQLFLGVLNEVREDLGLPEWDFNNTKPLPFEPTESEYDRPAMAEGAEAAFVRIAPWRFERHFRVTGPGMRIAIDAVRQSIIATPYEVVEMICNVNLMHEVRTRQNTFRLIFDEYTPEELYVAIQNRTFSGFVERTAESTNFDEIYDNLMLEIRNKFGVPEPKEKGKSEKYGLWSESRRKPVN